MRPLREFLSSFVVLASLIGPSAALADDRVLPAETIAARQHFFGLDNVNAKTGAIRDDVVILSWTGVSDFVASFKGHVVFMDSYIGRNGGAILPAGLTVPWPSMQYVGSTPAELATLKPELLLFGHAHFDHNGDLPTVIRANPDTPVYGTAEHCRDIKLEVPDVNFTCVPVFKTGAPLGTVNNLGDLLPGVSFTAVKHPHSAPPPDPVADPPIDSGESSGGPNCQHTAGLAFDEYPVQPNEPQAWGFSIVSPPSGIIAIAWQIRVGQFALLWEDTAGYIVGNCAVRGEVGCQTVPAAFASLPKTDVRLGAVAVAGRSVVVQHSTAVGEKVFIPLHHDACGYIAKKSLEVTLATIPASRRPVMQFISDPGDYLRPIIFNPNDPIWNDKRDKD
jgi:hypothetical protein